MISIIVPVYKVEKYLKKCVESIQNQTYADLEIILVDDGSPDNCGKICDEISQKDNRVKVIHKKNEGLAAARNTGLQYARGEYIAFVDSDDYIKDTMFEIMFKKLTETKADIAMCGSLCVDEDGNILSQDIFPEGKIYVGEEIVNEFILTLKTAVWNKLFRKEIIYNKQFPIGRIHGEDLVFITSFLNPRTKLVTVSEAGYYYVKHAGSITTKGFSEKSFDEVYCKDEAYDKLLKEFPKIKNKALIWKFRSRMNVNRKLIIEKTESFSDIYDSYFKWLDENYKICKAELHLKEKVEFILYRRFTSIYKKVINFIVKNRR